MRKMVQTGLLMGLTCNVMASEQSEMSATLSQLSGQKVEVTQVNKTAMNGVKEIVVKAKQGNEIIYMSDDGQFIVEGNIINIKSGINLKTETERSLRKELMADHAESLQSIDFYPDAMKQHVTVFTDIDCGYCRKLHEEIDQYNDLGIGVSYVFFPRGGLNSGSYDKAVNVWCAEDQQQALSDAKSGGEIKPMMCENPITSQFNLGIQAGVHKVGTPSIVLTDGTLVRGYMPPKNLKAKLDQLKEK
ncbi:thioredoxin fold domain-containing protein [Marinicella rhabdoformis]|uniref:thioredoxin fold domain-containing protein n=1 Tax=Marinicella rhabdoformis TaxID=2580566 RepID=UPI0012AEB38E|nr:thioredoxin fold domain-containing protein [Marinicella rhabdoformis]